MISDMTYPIRFDILHSIFDILTSDKQSVQGGCVRCEPGFCAHTPAFIRLRDSHYQGIPGVYAGVNVR
jgi:hypothetical protein